MAFRTYAYSVWYFIPKKIKIKKSDSSVKGTIAFLFSNEISLLSIQT
ncbi:hypothetical protein HNR74_001244 [Flammeovirga kamogawensis]|nr:hypothetical protein [Flammeovirga kamogawensis]